MTGSRRLPDRGPRLGPADGPHQLRDVTDEGLAPVSVCGRDGSRDSFPRDPGSPRCPLSHPPRVWCPRAPLICHGTRGGVAWQKRPVPTPPSLRAPAAGASLKHPRRLEGILNGTSVASGEVSDNHHVLDVPGRDAEGSGKLPQYRVAVIEIGADHHMYVVKLACNQPAVVPPLGQPFRRGAAHTRQALGQAGDIVDVHLRGLPWLSLVTITGSPLRLCDRRAITSGA